MNNQKFTSNVVLNKNLKKRKLALNKRLSLKTNVQRVTWTFLVSKGIERLEEIASVNPEEARKICLSRACDDDNCVEEVVE